MKRRTALPFVVAALLVTVACSEPGRIVFPSSPTPAAVPRAFGGASPNATPITVGEHVRATVALSDAGCEFGYGPEPCLQFAITPADSGVLSVQLQSDGPSELALMIAGVVSGYSTSSIQGRASVSGGTTYEVRVSLHGAAPGKATQLFELTTSLVH